MIKDNITRIIGMLIMTITITKMGTKIIRTDRLMIIKTIIRIIIIIKIIKISKIIITIQTIIMKIITVIKIIIKIITMI